MYNPQKVYDLLDESGVEYIELLKALGRHKKTSMRRICDRDIKVSTLEGIADFFNVSIDTFFERNVSVDGVQVNGSGHKISNISVGSKPLDNTSDIAALERLITEKDKRIELLESMVSMLQSQLKNSDKTGTDKQ